MAWYICESKFHSESKFSARSRNFDSEFQLAKNRLKISACFLELKFWVENFSLEKELKFRAEISESKFWVEIYKALSTCPKRSLRSQWDNGQARHSLNLSLPFVVAYCLTEISAFSQAMWTKPNMDTQRKNTWETMSCLRFECSLWMPSGKRAYCRVGKGGWVALTLICWGFL